MGGVAGLSFWSATPGADTRLSRASSGQDSLQGGPEPKAQSLAGQSEGEGLHQEVEATGGVGSWGKVSTRNWRPQEVGELRDPSRAVTWS